MRFLILFFPFAAPAAFGGVLVADFDGAYAIFALEIKSVKLYRMMKIWMTLQAHIECDSARFLIFFFSFAALAAFGGTLVADFDGVFAIFAFELH